MLSPSCFDANIRGAICPIYAGRVAGGICVVEMLIHEYRLLLCCSMIIEWQSRTEQLELQPWLPVTVTLAILSTFSASL